MNGCEGNHKHGRQVSCVVFRTKRIQTNSSVACCPSQDQHVGRFFMLTEDTLSSMTAVDFSSFSQPACGALLITAEYLYHCSGFAHFCALLTTAEHLPLNLTCRTQQQNVKLLLSAVCTLQPTHPYTHDQTHTHLALHTHAHTYMRTDLLLKVLTWAMPPCQLFPVGRLSTYIFFHASSDFIFFFVCQN